MLRHLDNLFYIISFYQLVDHFKFVRNLEYSFFKTIIFQSQLLCAGASDDAEVVIFAQEEDADGFGVEITTSSGVTAIANIPASMFTTGDRISINTATIDDRLQNVPVVIRDEDGVAEQPQTIPAVVTDPDGKQTTTIFLPIVTQ